jgi:hypothetical protein
MAGFGPPRAKPGRQRLLKRVEHQRHGRGRLLLRASMGLFACRAALRQVAPHRSRDLAVEYTLCQVEPECS